MRGKDNPCYGCTEATGRAYNCHTLCDGYKQFQDDCKEERDVIKRKNPYYKSLSKEKFMKRNALNRNRREESDRVINRRYQKSDTIIKNVCRK